MSFSWVVVAGTLMFVGIFCISLGSPVPCVGAAIAFVASVIATLLSVRSVGRLPSCVENGGCVRDLVPHLQQPKDYTSREQVAERFKAICEEQLGLDLSKQPYWEDANFVRDWNCG